MLFYLSLLETEEQKKNFIEIYRRNRGGMYRVAYGILGQKEEAENAVRISSRAMRGSPRKKWTGCVLRLPEMWRSICGTDRKGLFRWRTAR